jgi:lipoyl(octanoyl) transferase
MAFGYGGPKGDGYEDKIAAIGIRVKQWVTLHGMAPVSIRICHIFPASCRAGQRNATASQPSDLGIPRRGQRI